MNRRSFFGKVGVGLIATRLDPAAKQERLQVERARKLDTRPSLVANNAPQGYDIAPIKRITKHSKDGIWLPVARYDDFGVPAGSIHAVGSGQTGESITVECETDPHGEI